MALSFFSQCFYSGDSRTILVKRPADGGSQSDYGRSRCRRNSVKFSTADHRPSERLEQDRIEAAGARVEIGRVQGDLAVSRALGDFQYKMQPNVDHTEQPVSCIPDITIIERDVDHDEFLILGCDGVFDVLMNNEVALMAKDRVPAVPECLFRALSVYVLCGSELRLLPPEYSR